MGHLKSLNFIFDSQGEYEPLVIISISFFLIADLPTILEPSLNNNLTSFISAFFKLSENSALDP